VCVCVLPAAVHPSEDPHASLPLSLSFSAVMAGNSAPLRSRSGSRPPSSFPATALAALMVFYLCSVAQPALARLERQTYVSYRTPHLCSYSMMEAVKCGGATPMCCVASSAIRCCPGTTSCGNCTEVVVGYEMPKSSVILGCFSLSILVLLGSIVMSGVGRHLAWVLERRRVIENYRKRLVLRRAEAREFKKELAETEAKDIEDSVACVICCARHIDVALTPCGHVCCCRFCAKRLRECPVCRAAVQRCFDLPLYYVKQLVKAVTDEGEGDEEGSSSPTTAPPPVPKATTYNEANDDNDDDAATHKRKGDDAPRQIRSKAIDESLVLHCNRHFSEVAEDAAEEEAAAAPPTRVNPYRGKRYAQLFNEDNDDEEGAAGVVSEAATGGTAAVTEMSLSTRNATAGIQPATARLTGYISVEK
jgi:hypothetical protein